MLGFQKRLAREEGFTLIELLIVMVIIGILLAIAVPSYLGFRSRAQDSAAQSNIRQAVPSAEAYYESNNSYTNLNYAALKAIDSGVATASGAGAAPPAANTPGLAVGVNAGGTAYCLEDESASGTIFYFAGPGGTVTSTKPTVAAGATMDCP